jgi:predicted DNA-binding transcriptional regulator YafY
MRADRLLSIVLLLQTHDCLTAGELAARLEVSERTIFRDMDALSIAGVPVFSERGRSGGWSLLEGYRTTLTGLNAPEIQALLLNTPSQLLSDLGLEEAADVAMLKVLAALPQVTRRDAQYFRERIHFDAGQWFGSQEDIPCLVDLQQALWQDAQLEIEYQRGDGEIVSRIVDPLGLVAKGHVWYFIAAIDGDIRTYRVSRMSGVRQTGKAVIRPADFDLAAYWSQSTQEFLSQLPSYTTTLRVKQSLLPRIKSWRYARVDDIAPVAADGWLTIQVDFEVLEAACERVLSLGTDVIVLEPAELRASVLNIAQAIVQQYAAAK